MNTHVTRGCRVALLALLAGGWAAACPAAHVITAAGTIEGSAISADAKGEITLKLTMGERVFAPGEYIRAVADEPPEYGQAKKLIAAKKPDQALELLNTLVMKYKWLDWDIQATLLAVEVEIRRNNAADAVRACEKFMGLYPRLKDDAPFQAAFRRALIGAKAFERAEPMLTAAISSGNRANAAHAQLQRGDLRLAQGRTEEAAMDFLRTALLFTTEKEIQPEALFKAAGALEKMNDKAAAKILYQKLKAEYPNSAYAGQAAGKI